MKSFRGNSVIIISSIIIVLTAFNVIKTYALYEKRLVIVSGEEAPGTGGAVFSSTLRPWPVAISNTGKVIFYAYLEGGGIGYWVEENHEVSLLIRENSEIPFLPGQIVNRIVKVYMDLSGQIGLNIEYSPTGEYPYTHGFFMEENGSMVLKVYDGMTVSPGITLKSFYVLSFNGGKVLFFGVMEGEGIHGGNSDIMGMFGQDGFTILSRKGDPMTDVAGNYVNDIYAGYNNENTLDHMGNTIFQMKGFDHDTRDEIGVTYFWSPSGGLSKIIDSGTGSVGAAFGAWRLNASGNILNKGTFEDDISIRKNGDFQKVVSIGDVADGTDGATFTSFNYFVFHDNDMVSVSAATSDGKTGIWMGDETGVKKVIRVGDPVPGLEEDMVFDGTFYRVAVNASGQVAFNDWAVGSESDLWGLWVGDLDRLELVTIMDEQIEIAPGDVRTVEATWIYSDFNDLGRTGADGYPTIFNDNGEIAFGLTFNEGGNAFVVASKALVVNSTGDAPDIDPGDGCCDTGDTLADGQSECTLRAAIMEANAMDGKDRITYDIPVSDPGFDPATDAFIIQPEIDLPECTDPTDIIGTTAEFIEPMKSRLVQNLERRQRVPKIVLDGRNLHGEVSGLQFPPGSVKSSLEGLVIIRFPQSGILIGCDDAKIRNCFIGTNPSLEPGLGNGGDGIQIQNASGVVIGGYAEEPGTAPGNIISGNRFGIYIIGERAKDNKIIGNVIGDAYSTSDPVLDNQIGVRIENAPDNFIGGDSEEARNIISGNREDGVRIIGANASNNRVKGNYIGTDWTGKMAMSNGKTGVTVSGSSGNFIGGRTDKPGTPPGNVISGNNEVGVLIEGSGADSNRVWGNIIGLDKDGEEAIGSISEHQKTGVLLDNVPNNTIGDSTVAGRNVISGNITGIEIRGSNAKHNRVWGNLIGLLASGTDSPSLLDDWGILIYEGVKVGDGASDNDIGDFSLQPGVPPGNVISGHHYGVTVESGDENRIRGNLIGPDSEGAKIMRGVEDIAFWGNFFYGVVISGSNNTIGGTDVHARNVISGNLATVDDPYYGTGVYIQGNSNRVLGNYIGVTPDGTTRLSNYKGIYIYSGAKNLIGNSAPQPGIPPGNVISGNNRDGIMIGTLAHETYVQGNLIGLNAEGEPLHNWTGIFIKGSYGNIIGGLDHDALNVISGNQKSGIIIEGPLSTLNKVLGNRIGTDKDGTENLANGRELFPGSGILIRSGANHNYIGEIWAPNLIHYNHDNGVRLENSILNKVAFNSINSSKTGVELNVSIGDVITNNQIWYNETGISIVNYTSSTINANDIKNGGGSASGIHLDNAWAEIYGNSITEDAGDGIAFENGADGSVYQNNIFNNQGFGLNNTDESVMVVAQDNWWGDDNGPGGEGPGSGDEVSTGVDYANWRTEMVSLVVSTGFDTIYIPPGEDDSVLVSFRNWQNPTETVEVSVTDDLGWVQEPTTFQVTLDESYGGGAMIQLAVPGDTEEGTAGNVIVTAVSQTDPGTSETDSFLVLAYGPVLTYIFVAPDSVVLLPGDTVQYEAVGMDQNNWNLVFTPTWSATGGVINETGVYTAGDVEGVYVVTATDESGEVQGHAHVEIQRSVGVEGNEELSDHRIPTEFHLSQNYPNPFNPVTTIEYALPEVSSVRLEIYNIIGQLVEVLIESNRAAGFHAIRWDASGLASGVYFYRIHAGDFTATKRMVFMK